MACKLTRLFPAARRPSVSLVQQLITIDPSSSLGSSGMLRLQPRLNTRSFGVFEETLAAKRLFCDLKAWLSPNEIAGFGEVKVLIKEPNLGMQMWRPSQHCSLEGYLRNIPHLMGFDIPKMHAEFDYQNEVTTVVNRQSLLLFLGIPEEHRRELRLFIPRMGALARGLQAAGFVANEAADRIMNWCTKKFSSTDVTQEKVDEERKALVDAKLNVQADTARQTGDIKEFKEVEGDKIEDLIKTLTAEGVPKAITNAISRATLMKKNSEAVFDLQYKNGKLEHAFMMQIISLKKQNGKFDILMAHFQVSFTENNGQETGTLSLDQMAVLQKYIEVNAMFYWKKKADDLLANKDGADEFLSE